MKNIKVVSLALSVSLSVMSAFDLSNVGKALEKAQDAGIVTTGIPTQKQFDAKLEANAKASVKECKKFYHNHQIELWGQLDTMLSQDTEVEYQDMLAEWDRQAKKPLDKFKIKTLVDEYEKAKKNSAVKDRAKTKLHNVCKVVLSKGLTKKEQEAFRDETYEKYNLITGTERNKKK